MQRSLSFLAAGLIGLTGLVDATTSAGAMPAAPQITTPAAGTSVVLENVRYRGHTRWYPRGGHGGNWGWRNGGGGYGYRYGHRGYYGGGYYGYGYEPFAFGALGFATGAIIGSQVIGSQVQGSGWQEACASKYRSFDWGSGTYLGYDGYRHRCVLP